MVLKYGPIILAALVGAIAIFVGLHTSSDPNEAWRMASRYTAQVGFPFLIITYSASSLVKLGSNDLTRSLMKNRKYWGLSFATTHTFHLYALLNYLNTLPQWPPVQGLLLPFAVYALLYGMALTSNQWGYRTLGRNWKRLHSFGIHLLWLIFTVTYIGKITDPDHIPIAGIYVVIAILALLLRIAAWHVGSSRKKQS